MVCRILMFIYHTISYILFLYIPYYTMTYHTVSYYTILYVVFWAPRSSRSERVVCHPDRPRPEPCRPFDGTERRGLGAQVWNPSRNYNVSSLLGLEVTEIRNYFQIPSGYSLLTKFPAPPCFCIFEAPKYISCADA